jgi:hypothetical protein
MCTLRCDLFEAIDHLCFMAFHEVFPYGWLADDLADITQQETPLAC